MLKQIMLFNDSEEILTLVAHILQQEGYETAAELFGTDEVTRIKAASPDLVILDCSVGQMSKGWQLIQQLRLLPETTLIPVVFCIYTTKKEELTTYLSANRLLLLPKPYNVNDLLITVQRAFEFFEGG
jgi:CheY-like chemotaxis protein